MDAHTVITVQLEVFVVMLEVEFVWVELESIEALCVIIFGLRTPVSSEEREESSS